MKRIACWVCMLVLLGVAAPAGGRWRADYAELPPEVQAWYRDAQLTAPAHERLGFWGCCKYSDVVQAEFKVGAAGSDEWFYRLPGEPWRRVAPDIIHWGESAPGGRATLFVLAEKFADVPAGTPTCFWPPAGGL